VRHTVLARDQAGLRSFASSNRAKKHEVEGSGRPVEPVSGQ
jgi:hypothetical protein